MEKDGKEEGKKKTKQKIRVGGSIGVGVLVIGGLLMLANFAIKRRRNKTRDSNKNPTSTDPKASHEANNNGTCVKKKNEDEDQGSQGLHFLLQTSSTEMTYSSSSCEGHVDGNGDGSSTTSVVCQESSYQIKLLLGTETYD